jgi:transcriptional antiterminator RfaH
LFSGAEKSCEQMNTGRFASDGAWLVVNTHPHRENTAIENLLRQDFDVYCPMMVTRIRHARRICDAQRPVFPTYIFVDFSTAKKRWRPILSTYGVRSVVRQGDQPSLLNGGFIKSLKSREVDGVLSKPTTPYSVGQQVALEEGPFAGLIGKIIELRDKDRLLVLLDLLSQKVKVQIDANGQSMTVI